jgi:hypothetical protein
MQSPNKHPAILFFLLLTSGFVSFGQNLELKDLNVPNSPAFTILDFSPKVIDKPGTAKTFTASIVNLVNQGSGIPKNFAMEVAPYWLFPNKLTVYKYLGIDSTGKQRNIFSNARNFSLSVGSVYKDSVKSLPFSANYLAIGIRINPIRILRSKVPAAAVTTVKAIAQELTNINDTASRHCLTKLDPTSATFSVDFRKCFEKEVTETLKKDDSLSKLEKRLENILAIKPLFQMDIAGAGSMTFKDNSIDDNHHHRSGVWTTMEFNLPLTKTSDIEKMIKNKNYLSIYGKARYIQEDSTTNYKTFTRHNLLDLGGRFEFEFDRFSISFETLHRINQTDKKLNTNRNVGIIQYKLRDDLYLIGSFGKNFGNVNNVVALFGLNWGFGKQTLIEKEKS